MPNLEERASSSDSPFFYFVSFSILHFPFSIVQDYRCCFDLFTLLLNDMANIVIIRGGVVGTEMTSAALFTEESGTDD